MSGRMLGWGAARSWSRTLSEHYRMPRPSSIFVLLGLCLRDSQLEDVNGNSYHPIQNDMDALAGFTPFDLLDPTRKIVYNDSQVETIAFGKYKGKTLVEVYATDPGYLDWIIKGDFSLFTKKAVKRVVEAMKNQ